MNQLGLFNGLWGGVSNTLGLGASEISEYTGSADKKREQELALSKLNVQSQALQAAATQKNLIIIAVVILVVVLFVFKKKKQE